MDDFFDTSENNVEVADPQETDVDTQETSENTSEVADPNPVQDAETNARFAEQRRNQELNEYRTKASSYEQQLNRLASFSGYSSAEELFQALEQAEMEQRIQQESQQLGIDEMAYRQFFEPVKSELAQTKAQLEQMQQERMRLQVDREVNDLRSRYDDFSNVEQDVFNLAIQNGYRLEDAYKLLTYESRIQNAEKQTEQKVLAQVTGRGEKQVLKSNDPAGNTTFDPENMSLKEIEALSERVRRGERITF